MSFLNKLRNGIPTLSLAGAMLFATGCAPSSRALLNNAEPGTSGITITPKNMRQLDHTLVRNHVTLLTGEPADQWALPAAIDADALADELAQADVSTLMVPISGGYQAALDQWFITYNLRLPSAYDQATETMPDRASTDPRMRRHVADAVSTDNARSRAVQQLRSQISAAFLNAFKQDVAPALALTEDADSPEFPAQVTAIAQQMVDTIAQALEGGTYVKAYGAHPIHVFGEPLPALYQANRRDEIFQQLFDAVSDEMAKYPANTALTEDMVRDAIGSRTADEIKAITAYLRSAIAFRDDSQQFTPAALNLMATTLSAESEQAAGPVAVIVPNPGVANYVSGQLPDKAVAVVTLGDRQTGANVAPQR